MEKEKIISYFMDFISIKTFIAIIIIYFIIVWIAIIFWVIKDISSRTFYEKYYEEVEWNIDYLTNSLFKKLDKKIHFKECQIKDIEKIKKTDKKKKKK